jgi:menaquinone-dependent protoporphyrinogen IX oxidase
MSVRVTAASEHGATREIAVRIADDLARRDIDVEVKAPEQVGELSRYDAFVTGIAITSGMAQTSNELHRSPPRSASPAPNLPLQQRPDRRRASHR